MSCLHQCLHACKSQGVKRCQLACMVTAYRLRGRGVPCTSGDRPRRHLALCNPAHVGCGGFPGITGMHARTLRAARARTASTAGRQQHRVPGMATTPQRTISLTRRAQSMLRGFWGDGNGRGAKHWQPDGCVLFNLIIFRTLGNVIGTADCNTSVHATGTAKPMHVAAEMRCSACMPYTCPVQQVQAHLSLSQAPCSTVSTCAVMICQHSMHLQCIGQRRDRHE